MQKEVWKSGLTSWMTFSSDLSLWIVSATCSYSVTMGAYVQQTDNFLMSWWKLLSFTNSSRELNECQVLLLRPLRSFFKKQIRSTWNKTKLYKVVAIELLKGISIFKKSSRHTDFLRSIGNLSVWLVTLKVYLSRLEIDKEYNYKLPALKSHNSVLAVNG